jgi:capsule polysaccharide export protein KpsE/RkpR
MTNTGAKLKQEFLEPGLLPDEPIVADELEDSRRRQVELLRLLLDQRRFILRASAIGLVAAFLIAFIIPKQYEASAQLMPPDSQSTPGMAIMAALGSTTASKGAGSLGSLAGDLLGMKTSGATFVGVLKSQSVQEGLVKQFNLRKVYWDRYVVDARKDLDRNTTILEDRKSGIITITVTDKSPQRAADIANAYVDKLNRLVVDLSTSSAHRERVFLEERLKAVRQDLDDATSQLAKFSSKNATLDMQQQGKAMLDAAGMLAGQLIAAQSELEGLRKIFTDDNVRVRSLNARVAELSKELDKLGGRNSKIGSDSDPPANRSGDLPFPSIRKLPLLGAEFAGYYRRAKIQETVFELLTEQFEIAKVQEAKETPSVKILDPAEIPEKKSFPPRLVIVVSGTFLALGLSIIWVIAIARWRTTNPNDQRKAFLEEIIATTKKHMPWNSQNGDGLHSKKQGVWTRLLGRRPHDEGPI